MDPLAQLQDIQLPEKINNYPLAIGWWIIALICIALLIFISIKIINYKKSRKVQQQAITQLTAEESMSVADCVTVLKWAALQYFPREHIANLYGEGLYEFLLDTLPVNNKEKFITLSTDSLQSMYKKNTNQTDSNSFKQASAYWLKHALPPKKNITPNNEISEGES